MSDLLPIERAHMAAQKKEAGYTHYWNYQQRDDPDAPAFGFTDTEWSRLVKAAKQIIAKAQSDGISIKGPMGSGSPALSSTEIALNGDDSKDESYEGFILAKEAGKPHRGFCKTQERPYDAVVVSILAAAKRIAPKAIKVSSDGGSSAIKRIYASDEDGKLAASTVEGLVLDYLNNLPKGHDIDLTDMARDPQFRGVHYSRLVRAVEGLSKKSVVGFDGVRVTKLATRIRSTWKEASRLTIRDIYDLDTNGDLSDNDAEKLFQLVSRNRDPEKVLRVADKMLRTHGVETLDPDTEDFSAEPFASYLNTGDLHSLTLAWVYPRSRWEVTTQGDLRQEMRRGRYASEAAPESYGGIVTFLRAASSNKEAAAGLYGYTKGTQRDVEATIRKAQKEALKIAKNLQRQEPRVAQFLQVHASRTKSQAAKILLAAINNVRDLEAKRANLGDACWEGYEAVGMKEQDGVTVPNCVPKTASEKSYSLYGFPDKVADIGLAACTQVRVAVGRITFDLHTRRLARHEDITGFLTSHAKKARCAYSRFLLASYPDHEQFKVAQEEQAQSKTASAPSSVDDWLSWEA